jgi:uncharacterized membrane protein YbhN (UPF0104 family)
MAAWLRKWWPVLRFLLVIAIVIAVGRQFAGDLRRPELWRRSIRAEWLALAGLLYLVSLGFIACYWYRMLRMLGQQVPFLAAIRAHYCGQLGKYLPGKAWALVVRASVVRDSVRLEIGIVSSFYEVLTSMATGVLLAALLFIVTAGSTSFTEASLGESLELLWRLLGDLILSREPKMAALDVPSSILLCLVLLLPLGIPILPPVFNRLAHRLTKPFRQEGAAPLPRMESRSLLEGMVLSSGCWFLMGTSLWSTLRAVGVEQPWTWETLAHNTASMAVSYVAGFVILFIPSGLVVREFFLTLLLLPRLIPLVQGNERDARDAVVLAVILLRLAWTAAELVIVGILYYLPSSIVSWLPDRGRLP